MTTLHIAGHLNHLRMTCGLGEYSRLSWCKVHLLTVTSTNDPITAPSTPQEVTIRFEKGLPIKVSSNGKEWTDSLELFIALNELGKLHGIGRIDIVEVHNRNPVLL
jgi:argininosuccinate synthase